MIGQTGNLRVRQSAIRIFAQEYAESSLVERGVGEYDPSFVISKIGARINRCLVSGGLERFERRDGDSGPFYRGQIRDPSGSFYFDIAPFQPELHPEAEELLARFESGDSLLISIVGRAKWSESEDGGIFTSIRAENFVEIDQEAYKSWMVDAADSTLRRLDSYSKTVGMEQNFEDYRNVGVPIDLIDGLLKARMHYSDFDTESYMVWILKALSTATGRINETIEVSIGSEMSSFEEESVTKAGKSDPREAIIGALSKAGDLVEYDSLVGACISSGSSREEAEDMIEHLRDVSKEISEPRFGFFTVPS